MRLARFHQNGVVSKNVLIAATQPDVSGGA